jgi:hypothetical protein
VIVTGVFDIALRNEGVWGEREGYVYIEHLLTFCLMEGSGSDFDSSRCAT